MAEVIRMVSGCHALSVFDLSSAYYGMKLKPEDQKLLPIMGPDGKAYYLVGPSFGLRPLPAQFQRISSRIVLETITKFNKLHE
jgi:hypothetical protein